MDSIYSIHLIQLLLIRNEKVRKDIEDLLRRAKENPKKNIKIRSDILLNLNDADFKLHTGMKKKFFLKY